MRQRFAKWMMGRNGMDALNRLLSVLTLILLCVSMFVHGYASRILWSLAVLGLIVTYFRMFSRNVYRRQQENGAYRAGRVCVCRAARAKSTSSAASAAHRSSARPEATADVWICDRKSRGLDPAAEGSL